MLDIPLTVKMRTGVHDKKWNALQLIPQIRNWGASLVTVSSSGFVLTATSSLNQRYALKQDESLRYFDFVS